MSIATALCLLLSAVGPPDGNNLPPPSGEMRDRYHRILDVGVIDLQFAPRLPGRPIVLADFRYCFDLTDRDLERLAPDLRDVRELNLVGTRITDAGLRHVGTLPHLRGLYLSNAPNVTDNGLAALRPLKSLRELTLSECHVTDVGLKYLSAVEGLESLDVRWTKVNGDGLRHFRGKPLKELKLSGTGVTDDRLRALEGLDRLTALAVPYTEMTDAGMKVIGKISRLQRLDVRGTHVTDEGLKSLQGLKGLRLLEVGRPVTQAGTRWLAERLPDLKIDR